MEQSWNPSTWSVNLTLYIISYGKWSTAPLNHATKFRHILHTFRFYQKSCCQRESSPIAKVLIKWGSPPVTLMNSAQPADFKNSMEYLSSIQHGTDTCQNSRKDSMIFLDFSKTCLNFMAWLRGLIYHCTGGFIVSKIREEFPKRIWMHGDFGSYFAYHLPSILKSYL